MSNFQGHMATSNIIKLISVWTTAVLMFSIPAYGQNFRIRQENYMFNMPMTRDTSAETFVITAQPLPTESCLPVAHFSLESTILTLAEKDLILVRIAESKISQTTPLIITGYSCELGQDQYNQTLSLQRARVVAGFLQRHGFTVDAVRGKGSQNPITRNPQQFFMNRRAEITIRH